MNLPPLYLVIMEEAKMGQFHRVTRVRVNNNGRSKIILRICSAEITDTQTCQNTNMDWLLEYTAWVDIEGGLEMP